MPSGVYERTPEILEAQKKYWENPEAHRRLSESISKLYENPGYHRKISKTVSLLWADPEYRKKVREAQRKRWAKLENRSKQSETIRRVWENSDFRENQMEKRGSLDFHKRQSKSLREAWANKTPEQREKESKFASEVTSELWENPNFRKKHSGENHWSWKGGIRRPYKGGWRDIRVFILGRDNNTCQLCGVEVNLCPHHVDYDVANMDGSNLITLCVPCNSRVNSKRKYWKSYFGEKMGAK